MKDILTSHTPEAISGFVAAYALQIARTIEEKSHKIADDTLADFKKQSLKIKAKGFEPYLKRCVRNQAILLLLSESSPLFRGGDYSLMEAAVIEAELENSKRVAAFYDDHLLDLVIHLSRRFPGKFSLEDRFDVVSELFKFLLENGIQTLGEQNLSRLKKKARQIAIDRIRRRSSGGRDESLNASLEAAAEDGFEPSAQMVEYVEMRDSFSSLDGLVRKVTPTLSAREAIILRVLLFAAPAQLSTSEIFSYIQRVPMDRFYFLPKHELPPCRDLEAICMKNVRSALLSLRKKLSAARKEEEC